mmetsp:Transcript_13166/g.21528  ORF Transcript_13166/g.21528 Transcript_13166/m.21528 type:complete len:115 (+) Transcript_13166:1319-1663(+)
MRVICFSVQRMVKRRRRRQNAVEGDLCAQIDCSYITTTITTSCSNEMSSFFNPHHCCCKDTIIYHNKSYLPSTVPYAYNHNKSHPPPYSNPLTSRNISESTDSWKYSAITLGGY